MWVAQVCAKPEQAGQKPMGSQIREASRMKTQWEKLPRDLIKFGVREHEQRKKYVFALFPVHYLTFMLNVVCSPKHKSVGTNLTQMSSEALGHLELLQAYLHAATGTDKEQGYLARDAVI